MSTLKIRSATVDDLDRVRRITKQAYSSPYKEDGFTTRVIESRNMRKEFLDNDFNILLAEYDGKIVGALRYVIAGKDIYLSRLAVLKTYRKRGIASRLIRSVEKIADKKECVKISLDCAQEKELPEYYEKLGFKVDKIIDHKHYRGVYMFKIIK